MNLVYSTAPGTEQTKTGLYLWGGQDSGRRSPWPQNLFCGPKSQADCQEGLGGTWMSRALSSLFTSVSLSAVRPP